MDEAALRGSAGHRAGLPIESVRRIACDSDLVVLVEDEEKNPLSVGRKTRVVPAAIKRALWARDQGGCRFPGCGRQRYLHAHHIVHWSLGGETRLDNLLLLCSKHHTLLHEGGFAIERDYKDRWFFRRPDGRAVPACGYRPEDVTDEDVGTIDEYFGGGASAEALRASAQAARTSGEASRASAEAAGGSAEAAGGSGEEHPASTKTRYAAAEITVNDASAEAPMVREPSVRAYGSAAASRRFHGSGYRRDASAALPLH